MPDLISYGYLFSAIGLQVIFASALGWMNLIPSLLGGVVFTAIGLLLYYTHLWGGADAKLLMGLGVVLGVAYPLTVESLKPFYFLGLLLVVGAVYGGVWITVLGIRNWRKLQVVHSRTLRMVLLGVSAVLVVLSLFFPLFWVVAFLPIVTYYLIVYIKAVEESCFVTEVEIGSLTGGEWMVEEVHVKGRKVMEAKTLSLDDLKTLRKHKIEKIVIKEGIPFVPIFLLSYVVYIFL